MTPYIGLFHKTIGRFFCITKRKGIFEVNVDVRKLLEEPSVNHPAAPAADIKNPVLLSKSVTITDALSVITRQMEASGNRSRTIEDYALYVQQFQSATSIEYVSDITANHIYYWLGTMNVSNQTKLTRLKCLKVFLSRCFDNRWIEIKFWKTINIKVDQKVKEGATEREINTLLSLLDLSNFVQLRDAV
jgi:integrase/recombinase XerD